MARFDHATYGADVYAEKSVVDGPGHLPNLSDAFISAVPLDDHSVNVSWSAPAADHVGRILMRSTSGYPIDPSTAQGVPLLIISTVADPPDVNLNVRTLPNADVVPPGSEVFYVLFVAIPNEINPDQYTWAVAARTRVRLTLSHNAFDRLRNLLPWAFTATDGAEIEGNADNAEPLSRVLSVLGTTYDKILTDADRLLLTRDARLTPEPLIVAYSQTLGVPIEPALGPIRQRSLAANSGRIFALKGTPDGIQLFTECITGFDITIVRGKNMFPSVAVSAYDRTTDFQYQNAGPPLAADDTLVLLTNSNIDGWGLPLRDGVLTQPVWITYHAIAPGHSAEYMRVTEARGGELTVTRGEYGTPAVGQGVGVVIYDPAWSGWSIPPGYTLRGDIFDVTTFAPAVPTIATQTPGGHGFATITKETTTNVPVEVSYSAKRFVSNFVRETDGLCRVTTFQPHDITVGQSFTCYFGDAVAVSEQPFHVASVLNEHQFIFQLFGDQYPQTMTSASFTATPAPYIQALPCADTTLSVIPGVTYSYSAKVRPQSTVRQAQAVVTWYDAYGAQISNSTGTYTTEADTSTWTTVSVSAAAPAKAVLAGTTIRWNPSASWAVNEAHFLTQHQFEQANAPTSYDEAGLIRVGIGADAQEDPYAIIRRRTTAMLEEHASDERRYRVEFLNRSAYFPTPSSWARLDTSPQTWGDIDFYARVKPSTLLNWSSLVSASDTSGVVQWDLSIGATSLRFRANESVASTRATYGVGEYGFDQYSVESAGAGTAYGEDDYGEGNYGGSGVFITLTSASHGLTVDQIGWVRVTRNAVTGEVKFYKAADSQTQPTTWTLISTHSGIGGDLPMQTINIVLGSVTVGGFTGDIYAAEITRDFVDRVRFSMWAYDALRRTIRNTGSLGGDWILVGGVYPDPTLFPGSGLFPSASAVSIRSEFP